MNLSLPKNSRFPNTTLYQEDDGSPLWSLWNPPVVRAQNETLYVLSEPDVDRPDRVASNVYGPQDVELWWYILYYNGIHDVFSLRAGDKLVIPDISTIPASIKKAVTKVKEVTRLVPRATRYVPPRFTIVAGVEELGTVQGTEEVAQEGTPTVTSQTFGFPAPKCDDGMAHFEVQMSTFESFSEFTFSSSTTSSYDSWRYFNPFIGDGSYETFPATGIELSVFGGSFVFVDLTPIIPGVLYYRRYRAIVNGLPRVWNGLPPAILVT